MDSRLSGLELCVSIRHENFRRKKNKENFIVMDSRLSGLELCVSIRYEKKIILMDSRLSGLERSIIFLGVSIRREY